MTSHPPPPPCHPRVSLEHLKVYSSCTLNSLGVGRDGGLGPWRPGQGGEFEPPPLRGLVNQRKALGTPQAGRAGRPGRRGVHVNQVG